VVRKKPCGQGLGGCGIVTSLLRTNF
jgi:hypothetical protein